MPFTAVKSIERKAKYINLISHILYLKNSNLTRIMPLQNHAYKKIILSFKIRGHDWIAKTWNIRRGLFCGWISAALTVALDSVLFARAQFQPIGQDPCLKLSFFQYPCRISYKRSSSALPRFIFYFIDFFHQNKYCIRDKIILGKKIYPNSLFIWWITLE